MAFDLVLFGGTGDLTWRKLMPALFQAWRHGKLPAGGRILAVSRQALSDDAYRAWLKERFHEVEHRLLPRAVRLIAAGRVSIDPDDPRQVRVESDG